MSRLTKIEQETVINFNASEEEPVVFTRDKAVMRKLDTLVIVILERYLRREQMKGIKDRK